MKISIILNILILLASSIIVSAQPTATEIQWQKSLGGTGNDNAKSVQATNDGGFIVAGYTNLNSGNVTDNHGGNDVWIVKLDENGIIQWQKCFGGTSDDYANAIVQTSDSGYIIAGYTNSNDGDVSGNHGNSDVWIMKINSAGTILWQKCFGGTGSDNALSVKLTSDSGYIVCGYTGSSDGNVTGFHGSIDFWILKLNASGDITWQKSAGGGGSESAASIIETADHNFVAIGFSTSNTGEVTNNKGYTDAWIVKLSGAGVLIWQKNYGGVDYDYGNDVKQTPDGGYIIAGSTKSLNIGPGAPNGSLLYPDFYVFKLNSDGTLDWERRLGGINDEAACSVSLTADGGYVLGGYTSSYDGAVLGNETFGRFEYWLLKIASTGLPEWQKCFGGTGDDKAFCMQPTADGGYVLAGSSKSINGDVTGNHGDNDFWVVKLRYLIDVCPTSASAVITSDIPDVNYTWQVNTGSSFVTISNNANYSGVTTSQLHLNNIPSAWNGYQYRYVMGRASGAIFYSTPFTVKFSNSWTGAVSTVWEDPANWSCGVLPDMYTDVIIRGLLPRYPVLNSNVSIRSLTLSEGATFMVNAGYSLAILH